MAESVTAQGPLAIWDGWKEAWYTFAGFALLVAILFWIFFPKTPVNKNIEVKH